MPNLHHEAEAVQFTPTAEDLEWAAGRNDEFHSPEAPREPGLPLDEWVAMQASYFRSLATDAAALAAEALDDLAGEVRFMAQPGRAITPAEFRARKAAWLSWMEEAEGEPR